MSRYGKALERLYVMNRTSKFKYGLENVRKVSDFFGRPEKSIPCVHVTGTNGKGSVCYKLAQVLTENGLKTGLFQSPHVSTFRERITVDNSLIGEDFITSFLFDLFKAIDEGKVSCSFFEALTVLCFMYFKEMKIDVGVVEVGIGGAMDATNIIDNKILSIITSIGLDHTEILGDTIEEIAITKSRLISKNSFALAGPTVPSSIFLQACHRKNTKPFQLLPEKVRGDPYWTINEKLATKAVDILKEGGLSLPKFEQEWVQRNLKCRMERAPSELLSRFEDSKRPKAVFFDVGHNPQAISYLVQSIQKAGVKESPVFVFGTSEKKDSLSSIKSMSSMGERVVLVQAQNARAKPLNIMLEECFKEKVPVTVFGQGEIGKSLHSLIDEGLVADKTVVVCGSFFIMEEARDFLGFKDPKDPVFLNEMQSTKLF